MANSNGEKVGLLRVRSSRADPRRSWGLSAGALLLFALILPELAGAARVFALASNALLAVAVLTLMYPFAPGAARAALATAIGLPTSILILGAIQELSPFAISPAAGRITLAAAWILAARTIGATIASLVTGPRELGDVWLRFVGSLAATSFVVGALVRLLLPGKSSADRLGWLLFEEDNAAFIGVAREVLSSGPRGGPLAAEFGSAYVNLPAALLDIAGGPLVGESDVRLQAVTLIVVSTIVATVLGGFAMALLASLAHHRLGDKAGRSRASQRTALALGPLVSALSTFAALSIFVIVPMRTGFLTLVWGISLVAIGTTPIVLLSRALPSPTRAMLALHLVSTAVLLVGSWPFIAPALAPAALVVLSWVPWRRISPVMRQRPLYSAIAGTVAVVSTAVAVNLLLRSTSVTRVTSLGRELLTMGGSTATIDSILFWAALSALFISSLITVAVVPRARRSWALLGFAGPPAGAGLLYLGLVFAAQIFTGGELGYSGSKLFFGLTVLAAMLGFSMLASMSALFGPQGALASFAFFALVVASSPTVALQSEWWDRTDRGHEPHALATVSAIRSSSSELPIRCLPSPGTAVTERTRWAAYFCIRFMEEGFNGSGWGYAGEFVRAEGPTFEDVIAARLESRPSDYLFAYRFTMGPGWYGWSGLD